MREKTTARNGSLSFGGLIVRVVSLAVRGLVAKILALGICLRDPATPAFPKILTYGALAYALSPLDAIPDVLPAIGIADDVVILALALARLGRHVTPRHRELARQRLGGNGGRARADAEGARPRGATFGAPAEILGVSEHAAPAAIRQAYLAQVKRYHPDKVQHLGIEFQEMAEAKLKAINAAYDHFKERYPELR